MKLQSLLMTLKKIKTLSPESKFEFLGDVLHLFNNRKYEIYARELTIRILDQKNCFIGFDEMIKSLVRKSGLYPYLLNEFSDFSLQENMVIELYRVNGLKKDFVFHSLQKKVYAYIKNGKNVVLSATTSVGKSAIIDSVIASLMFNVIVIVVPTIALIDETRKRLESIFFDSYQVITHPTQIRKKEKIVYVLTQERVIERSDLNDIDFFVLDEFYKLSFESDNDPRCITLNIALTKLLAVSKQFYLIGPNINGVVGLDTLNLKYVFIPSDFSTVALNIYEYNLPTKGDERLEKALKILDCKRNSPTMIYCQSPNSSVDLVNALIRKNSHFPHKVDEGFINWISKHYHKDWIVVNALKNGIGMHHGSLPRAIQQKMVRMFNNGELNILICTSTIIEGVNTSAENVIIYDRRKSTPVVSNFTHKNIQGRAGRMGRYYVGNVYCLETIPKENKNINEVIIPVGVQDENSPLSLLYGINSSFLTSESKNRISFYESSSVLSHVVFSKNPKYSPEKLDLLASKIKEDLLSKWSIMMWSGLPDKEQMRLLCDYILDLEFNSLGRVHLNERDDLASFISQYIHSNSYSDFLEGKISHYSNNGDISSTIDWLLSVLRNCIGYNIPASISAISQIITFLCESAGYNDTHDYGLFLYKLENFHLPGNYAALDEFGIPIQVAEKLVNNNWVENDLDSLRELIKKFYLSNLKLSAADISFLQETL